MGFHRISVSQFVIVTYKNNFNIQYSNKNGEYINENNRPLDPLHPILS